MFYFPGNEIIKYLLSTLGAYFQVAFPKTGSQFMFPSAGRPTVDTGLGEPEHLEDKAGGRGVDTWK